jgi:branched-chain amino acid transport system substrate-binding protein
MRFVAQPWCIKEENMKVGEILGQRRRGTPTRHRAVAVAAAVTALAVTAAGCSSSSDSSGGTSGSSGSSQITMGALLDLSGQLASFGKDCQLGLQLAADEVNGGGGFTVSGHKYTIKMNIQDGQSDPTASVAATRTFMQQGVKFLFGPDTDATSLQVLGLLKNSDVLDFAGGAVDQELIGHPGYTSVFGVITPNPEWEGSLIPLLQKLNIDSGTVAILYPDDTAGQGVIPQFTQILTSHGYKAKGYLFPPTTTDFRSVVALAKASHPVAILQGYSAEWGLPITQAAVQLSAAKAVIGVDQTPEDVPLVIAKSSGGTFPLKWGSMAADQQAADPTTPGAVAFQKTWVKYLHQQPSADVSQIAIWFYDAVLNLVAAMKKAGTVTDTTTLANTIRSMTFQGAETVHYTSQNLPIHGTDIAVLLGNNVRYTYVPAPSS